MNQSTQSPQASQTVQKPEEASVPKKPVGRADAIKIYLFAGTLLLFFVIGLLFFLRPSVSEEEKRTLTKFPSFTWETFISGEYFSQISTWYADTFPGRDMFISLNQTVQNLYGIRTVQIVQNNPPVDSTGTPSNPNQGNGTTVDPGNAGDTTPVEKFDKVFIKGNRAFEIYSFTEANSDRYAAVISSAAEKMPNVDVYNIIVPLSYSVNLTKSEQRQIGASDVEEAISYMYGKMSDRVNTVEVFAGLVEHKDEYLYYRTDHHWTARGAYYAYVAFCNASGQTARSLDSWQKYEFEGFLGSLYRSAGNPPQLAETPDTVEAWVPNATNEMRTFLYDTKTWTEDYPIIRKSTDTYYASAGSKYNCFIAGDHPLIEIKNPNPETTNGKTIVVVKESYGNAFVPFLVDQYEAVYVVDYRYFKSATGKTLPDYVAEIGADEVLFINYIYATAQGSRLNEMESLIG